MAALDAAIHALARHDKGVDGRIKSGIASRSWSRPEMIYLWVAIGGALGSVARFWLNNAVAAAMGAEFPWGTLAINVIGSFVISFFGTLTSKIARFAVPPEISIFVMVGLCGGFTTFSSFSLQTIQLARAAEWDRAICYVLASVVLCLLACWLGLIAALALPGRGS